MPHFIYDVTEVINISIYLIELASEKKKQCLHLSHKFMYKGP